MWEMLIHCTKQVIISITLEVPERPKLLFDRYGTLQWSYTKKVLIYKSYQVHKSQTFFAGS